MGLWENLRSVARFRGVETRARARRLARCASVDDYRRIARRVLPRGVFDYVDGGAESERALRANVAAYERLGLSPRVLRDVSKVDTSVELLGRRIAMPLVLAPTGFTRMVDADGELAVVSAAAQGDVPYTLSTLSTRSIEEVAEAAPDADRWFQVYVWRDRALTAEMLERAAAARFSTIVLTVDTAVLGRRERDVRRGFTLPPTIGPMTLLDGLLHPAWTYRFVTSDPIRFANVARREETGHGEAALDGRDPVSLSEYIARQFDPALSWADVAWFRDRWTGSLLVKGVQSVDDVRLAADHGVDGVVLSNHGGRQLDDAPAPIDLVAPARDIVGDALTLLVDGGIRSPGDVLKAVALGADACMIGRPYVYALAVGGSAGVGQLLATWREGIARTLALCGVRTPAELDASFVFRR